MVSYKPREMLHEFLGGMKRAEETNSAEVTAFLNLLGSTYAPSVLDTKTKELISIAVSAYNRCEFCIVFHVYKALEAGASRQEIMDAAMVAVAFGGGPSMAYISALLIQSIDEFEGDFQ
ncbi:MAG: carboxymuconolactone decarboxylase family protein [Firmicutes bacterium]|nr:carboxymuconolactone decarboxylase family protein [Bacillota bacterium]